MRLKIKVQSTGVLVKADTQPVFFQSRSSLCPRRHDKVGVV